MPSNKARIDGVKASVRALNSERRNQYINLKTRAPKEAQEHIREAFLFFQDEAMMDTLVYSYL
jgi:hypothetical protein